MFIKASIALLVIIGVALLVLFYASAVSAYAYWIVLCFKTNWATSLIGISILIALFSVILDRKWKSPAFWGIDICPFLGTIAAFLFLVGLVGIIGNIP